METLVCFKNDIKPIFATATLSFRDRVYYASEGSIPEQKERFDQLLGVDMSKDGVLTVNSDRILTRGAGVFWFDNIIYNLQRGNSNFSNYIIEMVNRARKHWKTDSPELCVEALEYLLRWGVERIKEDSHPLVVEFKRRAQEVQEELNTLKRFAKTTVVDGMLVADIKTPYHLEEDLAEYLHIKHPGSKIVVNNFSKDPIRTVVYENGKATEHHWTDFGPDQRLTQWC